MSEARKNLSFTFDRFRLDAEKLMLYCDGTEVAIAPKVVKTLVVLVENAGAIITKEDLIRSVWDDSIVEESNLSQYLYILRKALGKTADGKPYIETLRRRGYRFNGEVQLEEHDWHVEPQSNTGVELQATTSVRREGNVLRLVKRIQAENVVQLDKQKQRRNLTRKHFLYRTALIILAAAGLGSFGFRALRPTPAAEDRQTDIPSEISVTRLTSVPNAVGATISLDGNFFVYAENDGESSKLFFQQTGQSSPEQIVSLPGYAIHAATITPDQRWVYFLASRLDRSGSVVYRIPSLGGPLTSMAEDVSGPVSFSPTGNEMVFARNGPNTSSFVIADAEGHSQRVILERRAPAWLFNSPAWSPDGRLIAFGEAVSPGQGGVRLSVLDLTTGRVKHVSDEKFDSAFRISWMPNGKGIALIGTRGYESYSAWRDQLYFVSYPEGLSRRMTNEGNRHNDTSLGVTNDGSIFVIAGNRTSQIWSMDASGRSETAEQISNGVADGRSGLVPLQDGRVAFLTRIADRIVIHIVDENGKELHEVSTKLQFFEELRGDPNGDIFVISANVGKSNHLFRVDSEGFGAKQLTFGDSSVIDASVSPDGKTIVYGSEYWINDKMAARLERISSEGERDTFSVPNCWLPNFSPNGSLISCIRYDSPEIVVINAEDGRELESHRFPSSAVWNWGAGWTPDGNSLVLVTNDKGVSNLTGFPRDGRKPHKLTDFTSGYIYRYAYSHDGRRLFLARGYPNRDAMLISGLR